MGRPRNVTPTGELRVSIREDWKRRLDEVLFSEVEDRIPYSAYRNFFEARIREFLTWRGLDLSPITGQAPGALVVRGEPEAVRILEDLMRDVLEARMIAQKEALDEASIEL